MWWIFTLLLGVAGVIGCIYILRRSDAIEESVKGGQIDAERIEP